VRELKHIMRKLIDRIVFFSLNNTIVLVLILLCVLLGILSDNFFTSPNLLNILNNFAVRGIVAFGVAVVIFAGGIDLSFSSILVCCAILATYLQPKPVSILAVILPLLLGAGLGLINGLIVAKLGINPLIATLGTQWVFQASLFLITRAGQFQGKTDNYFHYFGHGKILNIPFPIFLLLACCVLCWVITKKTLLGKYIFAHGSKSEALKLSE
jgi:ribose transport system permease protein